MDTLTADQFAEITSAPIIANTDDLTRPDWLALRKSGLGGSDAAAVLGVSKWTSSYALWVDKTTEGSPNDEASLAMRRGTYLEQFILDEAMVVDPDLTIVRAPYMVHHRDHEILRANVDGIGYHAKRRTPGGVEAKNVNAHQADQWEDGPPLQYQAQVQHYLGVLDLDWWVVCADFGGNTLGTFYVERDDELLAMVIDRELAWWQRHIIDGEAPEVDGHEATTAALSLVEADLGAVHVLNPDELVEVRTLFGGLRQCALDRLDLDNAEMTIKNRLRQMLGENETLIDESGAKWVTWKQQADKRVTDWQAVAVALAEATDEEDPLALVDRTAEQFVTTKPGNRPLVPTAGLKQIAKENANV